MIGIVQRHEALGMPGRGEDLGRIVDADGLVVRTVQDQKSPLQVGDGRTQLRLAHVLDELPADPEGPARERDLGLALSFDRLDRVPEIAGHVARIEGRTDRHDRLGRRDVMRRSQNGSSA